MDKVINSFPGYEFKLLEDGKYHNMYRGTDVGFGGYVYSEPGIYRNVALLDAASMHPTSIVLLNKLGKYTKTYADLRAARVFIKHGDYESVGKLFDGKFKKYLQSKEEAEALSQALKLPLNAFFGISFASFDNPARDKRDKNNIIALRGALFMRTLQDEIKNRGYKLVHVKTDSCKVANATPEIIEFIKEFGKEYGYEMEHECTYDRMCLTNKADYIAKYDEFGIRNKGGKKANEWTATGAQFSVPYIFKTLFTHEVLTFNDYCETKSVAKGALYLDMNENLPDVSSYEKELTNLEGKYKKGLLSDTTFEKETEKLKTEIAKGHNYIFIGRVGQFCPIKSGCGGGILNRIHEGRTYAATGTTGYRWLESEMVRELGREADIDENYYISLANDARAAIEQYGNFDKFVSGEIEPEYDFMNVPEDEELPFD